MNETPKGKLHRLYTQFKSHGIDSLALDEVEWLFALAFRQEQQLEIVNNELPLIRHRLQAAADQVYRDV